MNTQDHSRKVRFDSTQTEPFVKLKPGIDFRHEKDAQAWKRGYEPPVFETTTVMPVFGRVSSASETDHPD